MTAQRSNNKVLGSYHFIVLGAIGLGTIAWYARNKFFGSNDENKSISSSDITSNTTAPKLNVPVKPERNFVKVMQQQGRRVIFFYGSQTGTAEDYASRLAKECSQKYGISAMTADIELYDLNYLDTLPEDNLVFFIMATYGEGEPTDNAVEFWELINDETPQFSNLEQETPLKNVHYLVFGLGNKTYEHYNSVGRTVDQQLTQFGATRIGERGEGDDDGSLEEDFLAWQESMWPAFCKALDIDENNIQLGPRQAAFKVEELTTFDDSSVYYGEIAENLKSGSKIIYDAKRPYNAPIQSREIFQDGGDRHCLHVDIDISGTNLKYQTGDHVAIWPTNNEIEVNRLASVLGLKDKLDTVINVNAVDSAASKRHPFPVPTTYRTIFRHYLDICSVASRQTLMSLVEYAPTEEIKANLLKLSKDKNEFHIHVHDAVRNLGEALQYVCGDNNDHTDVDAHSNAFASVPFDLIVESISRLQPRYYSISSSSKEQPSIISATCVTLEYQPTPTPERTVYGVNTNYLWKIHSTVHQIDDGRSYPHYDLAGPRDQLFETSSQVVKIPIHVRRSQFKLPRNPKVPVIMVGPGTGVAPFRGFVRERALLKKDQEVGPTILFFGCRHSEKDFAYKEEWPELFSTLGEGSQLITAFSRETDQKVYVQHRLKEYGQQMWDYIQQGAYIYVCGDAKNMAHDVNQTFIHFAQEFGGKDEDKANAFFKQLRNTGRYQEDVWS